MIRVSYLITTRNRANYLERTLENVREFIEPQDELIIIDGGSTDHTAEIVSKNQDLVSCFVSENDSGEAHAFNKGLFRARGRFLKPITDDDYFYPEAMRRLVAALEAAPDVEAIQCGGEVWVMRDGKPCFHSFRCLPPNIPAEGISIFDATVIGLGLIVRKAAFEKTGGVSNNYVAVDSDLTCRLIECGCAIRYLDINLYRWYLHPHSGFNKASAMRRDQLMCAVRLGRWECAFQQDPKLLAEAVFASQNASRTALFEGFWLATRFARPPLRLFIYLGYRFVNAASAILRFVKRPLRRESAQPAAEARSNHTWTGELR